jgi:diadenosine tetraphosphate (Ap4A) HIT family hydrolase
MTVDCRTCELIERRDRGDAPSWDQIVRTPSWDLVHAFGTAMPGWLVLVVRRHITSVAELTDDEAATLGPLIRSASRALSDVVGCAKTYVVQFAESAEHPHVHVHVIPRPDDLSPELRGPGVFRLLGVAEDDAVPEVEMDRIAERVRTLLA